MCPEDHINVSVAVYAKYAKCSDELQACYNRVFKTHVHFWGRQVCEHVP